MRGRKFLIHCHGVRMTVEISPIRAIALAALCLGVCLLVYHFYLDFQLLGKHFELLKCDRWHRPTLYRDLKLDELKLPPRNPSKTDESKPYTFAVFFSPALDRKGLYFLNVRMLIHRLLHHPRTKTRKGYKVTVIVPRNLPEHFRRILRKDGAILYFTDILSIDKNPAVSRFRDTWTKLTVWNMTDYSRVALYDSDVLILENHDGIFEPEYVQLQDQPERYKPNPNIPKELYPYLFTAAADTYLSYRFQRMPFTFTGNELFNNGLFITKPDPNWLEFMLHLLKDPCWLPTDGIADQSFMNHLFHRDGPFPWRVLDIKYNKNVPQDDDLSHGVYGVHTHLDDPSFIFWKGVDRLYDMWEGAKLEMLKWSETNNPEGAEYQRSFYDKPDLSKRSKTG